jgi:hypothetical protein
VFDGFFYIYFANTTEWPLFLKNRANNSRTATDRGVWLGHRAAQDEVKREILILIVKEIT